MYYGAMCQPFLWQGAMEGRIDASSTDTPLPLWYSQAHLASVGFGVIWVSILLGTLSL